jgi:hypothetical protein
VTSPRWPLTIRRLRLTMAAPLIQPHEETRSAAFGPVPLHPGDGLVFAHRCHFSLAEANSGEEQVH